MKSINEMFLDTQNGRGAENNVNEFLIAGTILASMALGATMKHGLPNINLGGGKGKDGKSGGGIGGFFARLFGTDTRTPEERRKEEQEALKHQIEMKKMQLELAKLNGKGDDESKKKKEKIQKDIDEKNKKQQDKDTPPTSAEKIAIAQKAIDDIEDPVEKGKLQSRLDIASAGIVDENGNPRTTEDSQNWFKENLDPEDLDAMNKETIDILQGNVSDEDWDNAWAKEKAGIDQDALDKVYAKAEEQAKTIGVQLEADAAKRKEYLQNIAQKQAERDAQVKQLDEAIANAGTDEQKVKEAKCAKLEYLKKADNEILDQKEQLMKFNAECESGKMLNASIPSRKERCEKAVQAVADERKATNEKYEKESQEIEGIKPEDTPAEEKPKEEKPKEEKPKEEKPKEEKPKEEKPKEETPEGSEPVNPATIWKQKTRKDGQGKTKSYFNGKGASISQTLYKQKVASYQKKMAELGKKPQNESFSEFAQYSKPNYSYKTLSDAIRENLNK